MRHPTRLLRPVRLVAFTAVLLASAAGIVVTAGPATAAGPCGTKSGSFTHNDGVAEVSYTVTKYCGGSWAYVSGTLRDILCDNRAVRLRVGYGSTGAGASPPDTVTHGGGCNTSTPFSVDGYVTEWGAFVDLRLWSYNSWGSSVPDDERVYFQ